LSFVTKYYWSDQVNNNAKGGHVAIEGNRTGAYRPSVAKPEGKTTLRRPRRRWEDNIIKYH
jgi:hypothetical protein